MFGIRSVALVRPQQHAMATRKAVVAGSRLSQVRFKASQAAVAASSNIAEAPTTNLIVEKDEQLKNEDKKLDPLFESLLPGLKRNLKSMGVDALFPVQVQTLESCRSGKDMVVRSKTGSGKTLAFALPTVEKLLGSKAGKAVKGSPRAIVLAPTRELALQVHREFEKLAPSLNCVAVYGGASIMGQAQQLRDSVDIVIGTPGRVKDFLDRGTLKLDQIEVAILDEADEMLKVGFYEAIQEIYQAMPEKSKRQNLLFSATVSREVRAICEDFLNKPTFIDLVGNDSSKIPDTVEMCVTPVTYMARVAALSSVLAAHSAGSTKENPRRSLVFCGTKRECEDLSRSFRGGETSIMGGALHGDMSQSAREEMLSKFRDGSCLVLLATDVAARGLDIPEVDLVVHYSLPRDQDSFVHRSGRTGRAGRKGTNIIFYDPLKEAGEIRQLERSVGQKFNKVAVPGGPEMIRRQAMALAENLALTGAALQWIKPVADELRRRDQEKGTDFLAATLMALMGGNAVVRTISALNGRSGNYTINFKKVTPDAKKIAVGDITAFLKTLPSVEKTGARTTLVRDFHRVKGSDEVLADVPDFVVSDLLEKAKEAGFEAKIVEGVIPETVSEFVSDDRSFKRTSGAGGYSRDSYRSDSRRIDGYSRNRDYGGGDRRGGDRGYERPRSSSYSGGNRSSPTRRQTNDY